MKIEVSGLGPSTKIQIDGKFQEDTRIEIHEPLSIPFGLVYLNGRRVYDAEFWIDGYRRFTIPPWRELVDIAYSSAESKDWSRIDSIVNSLGSPKMDLLRRIARLGELIETSQENLMMLRWKSWVRVVSVFRDNARELSVIVDDIENGEGPPDVNFEFLPRLDRALINYVVSFKFVLDHLKWVNSRLPDRPEFGAISSGIGKLEKVDVVAFASVLRNHLTHGSVVDPTQRMEFTDGGAKLTLNFVPRVLLVEEDAKRPYSRPAKRYIENHLDRLSIKEFASDLNRNTLEFCERIMEKISIWHNPEVTQLTQWQNELDHMERRLVFISQDDPVYDVNPLAFDLNLQ